MTPVVILLFMRLVSFQKDETMYNLTCLSKTSDNWQY
jgi:hypothetical protein